MEKTQTWKDIVCLMIEAETRAHEITLREEDPPVTDKEGRLAFLKADLKDLQIEIDHALIALDDPEERQEAIVYLTLYPKKTLAGHLVHGLIEMLEND